MLFTLANQLSCTAYQNVQQARIIAERKRAEAALRESEERYRSILNASPDAIMILDREGRLLMVSPGAVSMFGFAQKAEVLGHVVSDFLVPEDGERALSQIALTFQGCKPDPVEYRGRRADGRTFDLEANCETIRDADGRPTQMVAIVRDISARKQAEKDLQKIQKLQSIGTLAGGIAHDFNNILMGLFGNLSLARDVLGKDHPGYRFLEEAEGSMNRAVRLTKQLLTFAKGGDPVREDVSLETLIREVAGFDLSGSQVKLVCQPAANLWMVKVDKGQIQQVISNLTLNARQAMPDGGHLYVALENAEVAAATGSGPGRGKYVKVTVRDEGTGIPPQYLDRIFDPYFTTKQTGSGLGLATAYSIVNKHGGHIAVASERGGGTTFTLYLPASEAAPQPDAAPRAPAPGASLGRPAKILVMDDEEIVRGIVSHMLKRCGFSVATAPGGRETIAMYQEAMAAGEPFDAVIMDLTIPGGIGGKDTIRELLAIDPHVRAVVSSGYADDPVMAHYADYGFKGIAAKPYTSGELRDVLATVLPGTGS